MGHLRAMDDKCTVQTEIMHAWSIYEGEAIDRRADRRQRTLHSRFYFQSLSACVWPEWRFMIVCVVDGSDSPFNGTRHNASALYIYIWFFYFFNLFLLFFSCLFACCCSQSSLNQQLWISTLEYTMKRNTLYAFLCWPCHIFVYAHIYDSLSWMESNIVTLTMAMTTTVTGQKVSSCAARALAPRGVNHPFHRTVCRTVERREQLIYIRIEGSTKRKENLQCVVNWDCRWPILVTEQMNHATSDRHHSMKRYFRLRFDGFHNVLRCYHRNDSREHWWTLNTMLGISIDSRINRWIG